MAPTQPALLEVQGVSKRFGVVAVLDGVSFSLGAAPGGEVVALLGPSGVGKTQLLRIMAGLLPPDVGAVTCRGVAVERGAVGLVAQSHPLFGHRTVLSNLLVAARAAGIDADRARRRALGLLGQLRLAGRRDHYPVQLSGGERQRVAILQQLMAPKDVLLLDEPFSALDRAALREVASVVQELVRLGEVRAVVIVTHDVRSALVMADRVLLLGRPPVGHRGALIQATHDCRVFGPAGDLDREVHPGFRALERDIESYLSAHWQVHERFKLFCGAVASDGSLGALAAELEAFASEVAAKSIGAEYLPASRHVLVTLGYREDEAPYEIRIRSLPLPGTDPDEVERSACQAARERGDVICHDLYEVAPGKAMLVLMSVVSRLRPRRAS